MTELEELDELESFGRFCDEMELYDRQNRLGRVTGVLGRLVSQGYNLMGKRLFSLFEHQRKSVLTKVRGLFVGRTGTATELIPSVAAVYQPDEAEIDLKATAYGVMEQLVLNGSHVELENAVGERIKRLARLEHRVSSLRHTLPVKVRRGIDEGLAEAMAQPYWHDITAEVQDELKKQLSAAIQKGESLDEVSARVRMALGTPVSKARAERIARTESTRALNSGLQLSRNYLADLGLVVAKRWVAVDPLMVTSHPTRKDHALAHGQEVDPRGVFLIGGEKARFPGDPHLSAGQSVNCRCLAVSVKKS